MWCSYRYRLFILCGVCLLTTSALPPPPPPHDVLHTTSTPSEQFSNHEILDDNGIFELFWKYNETHITFEAHVQTLGYVGLGLSAHGKMFPADVVVGWVKDGKTYFTDRHTIGHYEPIIDQSQDWFLIFGKEENDKTILKFVRKILLCDSEDISIEDGTTKIIYAWNSEDPIHETGLSYHGTNRGARNLLLLSPSQHRHLPPDAKHFDFLNKQFHLPARMTTYHCTSFKLPDIGGKNHMVMFEPILQKGNEGVVHHILVYHCPPSKQYDDKFINMEYECYEHAPRELNECRAIMLAWAVGGGPFYFPDDVGMPVGESTDSGVFVLETHYNNPTHLSDVVDSSGLRMYFTPTLRKYDGDIMQTGVAVDPLQMIPPGYASFLSTGYCGVDCTNKAFKDHPEGVKVFGIFPHSHLLGEAVRSRIIRNGVETVIADDENYDFDYQESRLLTEEVVIKPGDIIETECRYKSDDKSTVTLGGLSTNEEMCLVFLMYYPRVDIGQCSSLPIYDMYLKNRPSNENVGNMIKELGKMDWTNKTVQEQFSQATQQSRHFYTCIGKEGYSSYQRTEGPPPTISKKYVPKDVCSKKVLIG
ncbi:hypothetical protein SNE40_001271 [Patella caerulea]|uniref:DOMON domain-containing protein n=1 Tax=Patella caerulea TaxID=87958 RepID=A0AAN8KIB2_PATCE